jgi:hypothetical protein
MRHGKLWPGWKFLLLLFWKLNFAREAHRIGVRGPRCSRRSPKIHHSRGSQPILYIESLFFAAVVGSIHTPHILHTRPRGETQPRWRVEAEPMSELQCEPRARLPPSNGRVLYLYLPYLLPAPSTHSLFICLDEGDSIAAEGGAHDHAVGVQESLHYSTLIACAASAFGCLLQVLGLQKLTMSIDDKYHIQCRSTGSHVSDVVACDSSGSIKSAGVTFHSV